MLFKRHGGIRLTTFKKLVLISYNYKLDKQLLRRYTKGAKEKYIRDADYAALLPIVTREAAVRAIGLYQLVCM